MTVREPGGEERENKHGGSDLDGQGPLEELPGDGHVIGKADMGDEDVGKLDGGQGHACRAKAGAEPHRPEHGVTVLVLRRLGQLQHAIPKAKRLLNCMYGHLHRHPILLSSSAAASSD